MEEVTTQAQVLEGTVSAVIYQNEENGYTILRLDCGEEETTVVGAMPGISPGEYLSVRGRWTRHPTYGSQFKAEVVERRLPQGLKEIYHYLASGAVKGVGKATARLLVEEFGEDVFQVIEDDPEQLTRIRGISPKRAETIHQSGIPLEEFQLRVGAFGAEPWTENMRKELETKLNIKAYDIYGLTEICGPGVGGECECQNGTHLWEDHFFPEIVDPNTLQPVEPGQVGELVFTTLTKEGMPMLRYRTRDLTSLTYEKCACGRTAVRMGRILGRSDDMLIIRGVNVFPSQVESVILELPEFEAHYLIVVDRMNNTDTFQIQVEVRQEYYSDEMNKMIALKKKIAARMQSVIGLQPDIKIVEPRSIERSMGKAKHVIDKRKLV